VTYSKTRPLAGRVFASAFNNRAAPVGRNGAERLAPAYRTQAVERARQLAPMLADFKREGLSARQIGVRLTEQGISTVNGGRWHAQTVIRLMDRAGC
jgi:hypothetical protein